MVYMRPTNGGSLLRTSGSHRAEAFALVHWNLHERKTCDRLRLPVFEDLKVFFSKAGERIDPDRR